MKKLLLALALLLPTSGAWAQCNGTFPNNTVCGNVTGSANLPRATSPSAFLGAAGGTNGQQQYNNAGALGGFTQSGDVTVNTSTGVATIQPDAVTTGKIAPSAVGTTDIANNAVTAGKLATNALPTYTSRAAAAALDLSGHTVIKTLGYATAGDGGGATFKNVGSTLFTDSHVLTGTISNAGSAYTPGTYGNIQMSGGVGFDLYLNITVGGGGTITSVTIAQQGGYGYAASDVMTTSNGNIGGTGTGFTWTVSTVSTPSASFIDAVGTHWQYVTDEGNFINARQFGAKFDFTGTDGTSTNDQASIQAAINFAANRLISTAPHGLGGADGTAVYLPRGSSLVCGTIKIWRSVSLRGQGMFNTDLKLCDSGLGAGEHFVTICDPTTLLACFAANIQDLTLTATTTAPSNSSIAMIFSNSVQQSIAIKSVSVYAGLRECFRYTNGYGGAAKVDIYDFFCTMFTASANNGVVIDPTTTVNMSFYGLIVEAGGSGSTLAAVIWNSGNLFIDNFHTEGITTGIAANATVANYQGSLRKATGGVGCTELVKLESTNTLGNFSIGTSQVNGCTRLITNGQPGGANFANNTVKDIVCNPGNPCAP